MLRLAVVLILPCLIVADTTCPGGELSCPKGQSCCTVNNKPACCDDLEARLPSRSEMLIVAAGNSSVQNGIGCYDDLCEGTCCDNKDAFGNAFCCPHESANCCGSFRCCKWLKDCCGPGCCDYGDKCCSGSWCCRSIQRCGLSYMSCYGGAGSLSPTALVTLVAAWLVAYAVKRL